MKSHLFIKNQELVMSRMPSLARDELSLKDQEIYDDIAAKRGSVYGPFPVLLNSPQVAGRTAKLGEYLRYESSLEPKVLQLVTLTVAREWDCQCQWTDHEPQALEAGVPESTINALKERRAPEGLEKGLRDPGRGPQTGHHLDGKSVQANVARTPRRHVLGLL